MRLTLPPRCSVPSVAALLFGLCLSCPGLAQDATGTLDDWSLGQADIMYWQIGSEPTVIGAVSRRGLVTLDLPAAVEARQPLSQVFSCSDGGATTTDPDARYFITSSALMVGSLAEQQNLGSLVVATTRAAAAARAGVAPIAAGRYYQWIYTPDQVTIEGHCAFDVFPDGQTRFEVRSTYDMALTPGWNLFEVEMADIATASGGIAVALDRTYRIVDTLPPEAQWVHFPE